MTPIEPTPVEGSVRVTVVLDEVKAIKNPELVGKAEWDFRVWANGVERWRSEETSLDEGESVPLGVEIPIDASAHLDIIEVKVRGVESDMLSPDDHASGSVTLHRVAGFEKDRGGVIGLRGPDAQLELSFSVRVE